MVESEKYGRIEAVEELCSALKEVSEQKEEYREDELIKGVYDEMRKDGRKRLVEDAKEHYPKFEEIISSPNGGLFNDAKQEWEERESDFFEMALYGESDLGRVDALDYDFTPEILNIIYDHGDEEYSSLVRLFVEEYTKELDMWAEGFKIASRGNNTSHARKIQTSLMSNAKDRLEKLGFRKNITTSHPVAQWYFKENDARDFFDLITSSINHREPIDPGSIEIYFTAEAKALGEVDDLPEDFEERVSTRQRLVKYLIQKDNSRNLADYNEQAKSGEEDEGEKNEVTQNQYPSDGEGLNPEF